MGGASLLAGLIGGYSDAMLKKHKDQRDKEEREDQAKISVLQTAIATGKLTPEAQSAAFEQMEDILSDYGGKKSGFSLKNLIGQFGDTGKGGQQPQGGKGGSSKTPGAGGAKTAVGATGAAPPQTAGAMPTRQSPFQFRSDADIANEKSDLDIQATLKSTQAQMSQLSQDLFSKPLNQLTPQEKQTVVRYAYRLPDAKLKPLIVRGPNGEPIPALQDQDNGSVIGPDGALIDKPVEWKAPQHKISRVNVGPGGVLQPVFQDPDTLEVTDANTGSKVDKPNLLPANSMVPTTSTTTTVEPSVGVGPDGKVVVGPAITRESTTTRGKGTAGAIPSRPARATAPSTTAPSSSGAPPSRSTAAQPLPWAQPKNIGTQLNQTSTGLRQTLTQANKALADATKALAALQKESRAGGITGELERGTNLVPSPNVAAAQKTVTEAQAKATNAKRAVAYVDSMRQSVLDGTVDLETVTQIAQDLATKGYTTTKPPNVTRTTP